MPIGLTKESIAGSSMLKAILYESLLIFNKKRKNKVVLALFLVQLKINQTLTWPALRSTFEIGVSGMFFQSKSV